MKKVLFVFVVMFTMCGLSSCLIESEAGAPTRDVINESSGKVLFLKSSGCTRSAAAEKFLRKSFEQWKVEYGMRSDAKLENYVKFVELDEGAPGFNKSEAVELFKSAVRCYELSEAYGQINTPIICFGANHVMGWDFTYENKVQDWMKPYLEKGNKW